MSNQANRKMTPHQMTNYIEELKTKLEEATAERNEAAMLLSLHMKRAEAAEAKLANLLRTGREYIDELKTRAEAAEAANLRFYRAGIEAGRNHLASRLATHKALGQHGTYPTIRESILEAIRALPDPTDEQQDAIRKGETT
jgi:seryl-tRNA synthetase